MVTLAEIKAAIAEWDEANELFDSVIMMHDISTPPEVMKASEDRRMTAITKRNAAAKILENVETVRALLPVVDAAVEYRNSRTADEEKALWALTAAVAKLCDDGE